MKSAITESLRQPAYRFIPDKASWIVTERCNLTCPFCRFTVQTGPRGELTTPQALKLIECLSDSRVFRLTITGGEPLIREDLPELLAAVVRGNMRFTITTNGTLLTDEFAAMLAGMKRCDLVQISLDGPREFHDRVRGAGVFDAAVAAIERLSAHGIPVGVNCVLSKGNMKLMPEFAEFLEKLPLRYYRINPIVRHCSSQSECCSSPSFADFAVLIAHFLSRRREFRKLSRDSFGNFLEIPNIRLRAAACPQNRRPLNIQADGTVLICPNAPAKGGNVLGSLLDSSSEELWDGKTLAEFRRMAETGVHAPERCASCVYLARCRQYCIARTAPPGGCRMALLDAVCRIIDGNSRQ